MILTAIHPILASVLTPLSLIPAYLGSASQYSNRFLPYPYLFTTHIHPHSKQASNHVFFSLSPLSNQSYTSSSLKLPFRSFLDAAAATSSPSHDLLGLQSRWLRPGLRPRRPPRRQVPFPVTPLPASLQRWSPRLLRSWVCTRPGRYRTTQATTRYNSSCGGKLVKASLQKLLK